MKRTQKIFAWLKTKWEGRCRCPFCARKRWEYLITSALTFVLMLVCITAPWVWLRAISFLAQLLLFAWQFGCAYGRRWGMREGHMHGFHQGMSSAADAVNAAMPTIIARIRERGETEEKDAADWWKGGGDAGK